MRLLVVFLLLANLIFTSFVYFENKSYIEKVDLEASVARWSAYCNRYKLRSVQSHVFSASYGEVKRVMFPPVCNIQALLDIDYNIKYGYIDPKIIVRKDSVVINSYDNYYTGRWHENQDQELRDLENKINKQIRRDQGFEVE